MNENISIYENINVLVVDDLFTNRLLIRTILNEIGCKSEEADNGQKAIELLKKNTFHIILMDIEMPKMNGIEATKYIRNNFKDSRKNIPIVAITAHYDDGIFEKFKENGFTNMISKPFSVDKLLQFIQQCI